MSVVARLFGGSPGERISQRFGLAVGRALRTLIQGIAGAFPAAGVGTAVLAATYWQMFGYSCLAALVTAIVSFLNNVAVTLPTDPTQKHPEQ